jgi:hypothetical protein
MDGVLADFAAAFAEVDRRLFGPSADLTIESPEIEAEQQEIAEPPRTADAPNPRELRRRRDAIWREIHDTPDFWTTLKPLSPTAVSRIHGLMLRHGWEVFFITQRPATRGETVQRQTQVWLREQGFDLPSVLVIGGSRGAAAGALRLNVHVDDSARNCLDIVADSQARPILIAGPDSPTQPGGKDPHIDTVRSIDEALDRLEQISLAQASESTVLSRLLRLMGWKS